MNTEQMDGHWAIIVLGQLAGVLQVIASFVCAYFILDYFSPQYPALDIALIHFVALIALVAMLNIGLVFIHEMGHALAAWSVGRKVHIICVGYLAFLPSKGQFCWIDKPAQAEYAGFVSTSPIWPDMNRGKNIWVSVAGPLATGGIGLILLLCRGDSPYTPYFIAFGMYGFLDLVVNLIPMKWARGAQSDGLHIWLNLKGNVWTPEIWASVRLANFDGKVDIVSETEWADLRSLARQPFYGGADFRKLLNVAAYEKNDTETLDILAKIQKYNAAPSTATSDAQ